MCFCLCTNCFWDCFSVCPFYLEKKCRNVKRAKKIHFSTSAYRDCMTRIPMNSDNPTSLQIRTEILNGIAVNRKKQEIFLWNEQQALKNINYGGNFILIKTKKFRLSLLFLSACSTFSFIGFTVLNGKEYNNEKFI